jgi:hypothetical protein
MKRVIGVALPPWFEFVDGFQYIVESATSRASYNGITPASQAGDEGSTPFARSRFTNYFRQLRIKSWIAVDSFPRNTKPT